MVGAGVSSLPVGWATGHSPGPLGEQLSTTAAAEGVTADATDTSGHGFAAIGMVEDTGEGGEERGERGETTATVKARKRRENGHWDSLEKRRAFLESAAAAVGGWEQLSAREVRRLGGGGLIGLYGSLSAVMNETYSDIPAGARVRVPHGTWKEDKNLRALLLSVKERLGVKDAADWAGVTHSDMKRREWRALQKRYGTLLDAIRSLSPQEAEEAERAMAERGKRQRVKRGHWRKRENIRRFLESFAEKKGFSPTDVTAWAAVRTQEISKAGGGGILVAHKGSLKNALKEALGGDWEDESYRRRSRTDWSSDEEVSRHVREVGARLRLQCPEEWARVSIAQLRDAGATGLLQRMPLIDAVAMAYPHFDRVHLEQLRKGRKGAGRKAAQHTLFRLVSSLLAAKQ